MKTHTYEAGYVMLMFKSKACLKSDGVDMVDIRVEPDTRLKRVSGTDKALLPSTSIIRVIRVNICARIE